MTEERKSRVALAAGNLSMVMEDVNQPDNSDYVVSYVDILGFKSIINNDPTGKEFLPIIEDAVKSGLTFAKIMQQAVEQLEYRIFSDNICFWMPLKFGPLALSTMLSILAEFQLNLLSHGLLCRGGVAVGFHYSSEYTIYGPTIVKAVELEHTANYPRILIQPEIIKNLELIKMGMFYHQMERMKDDHAFLNYLWKIFYIEKEISIALIMAHREAILRGLEKYKDNPKILEKYIWLKNYHNRMISYLVFRDQGIEIKEEAFT